MSTKNCTIAPRGSDRVKEMLLRGSDKRPQVVTVVTPKTACFPLLSLLSLLSLPIYKDIEKNTFIFLFTFFWRGSR